MEVEQIAEGLWRWTTRHPEWTEDADWPAEVGCVYYESPEAIVLVDPLIPDEPRERERFLAALDRDVAASGAPVFLLRTVHWHERSIPELETRLGATRAAEAPGVDGLSAPKETIFWISEHRALVPGDLLLGSEDGGVRVCPDSWLADDDVDPAEVRARLRPLLDLPVERVLVSHGEPVLAGGREALERALQAPSAA